MGPIGPRASIYDRVPDRDVQQRQFRRKFGRPLNLAAPESFNDKMHWLMLNYRTPRPTQLADKYEVRNFVLRSRAIGAQSPRSLSRGLPFVRVDLCSTVDGVVFGEMTLHPNGGFTRFTPNWYDFEVGRAVNLPSATRGV